MGELALYDAARSALSSALRIDEVQQVRDQAERMRLYARQANDRGLMADAMEIQLRAERRLGELLIEAKAQGQIVAHRHKRSEGEQFPVVRLAEAGIGRKLSMKAQQLAEVPEAAFETVLERAREKIEVGRAVLVNPAKDFSTHDKQLRRKIREAQLGARQRALPAKQYGVIYADPEWPFATWSEAGKGRAAENHYPTSLLPVIASRPVERIAAADCALFLWITRPLLPAGLAVLEAWGFAYVTSFIWDKVEAGTGYWARDNAEILLLGRRGDIPCPAMGTQYPALVAERKRGHSVKPEWAAAMIEAYFPHLPKIELNARAHRPGWDAWGLEAPEDGAASRTLARAFEEAGQ
jgi:N6-adenosine-specific RNA methylase IME4